MSKTVNFEDIKTRMDAPLASGYTIFHKNEDGKLVAVYEFDGDEVIATTCPQCGRAHQMSLSVFFEIVGTEFDLYGTSVYCSECSAKRVAEREGTDQPK